ncbi:Gfo/Idh/MocA family oxidoreductase [Streptomyces sp. NPDC059944]|uniref:Gfo/Idh/MocA family oxidoreductase n=1 Tax=unclassified Streptomyces TaxID=2593676 RepID=UPI00363E4A5E
MPDPRKPVGVDIVGLSPTGGCAAGAHLPALRAVDGIELRALAASSEASAQAAGAAYDIPAYTSVEQLAGDENVDLVVVAVKVPQHRELVSPVLKAGVPVLFEWPLAVDLREAEEMERAAGTSSHHHWRGVRFGSVVREQSTVGPSRRSFSPAVVAARGYGARGSLHGSLTRAGEHGEERAMPRTLCREGHVGALQDDHSPLRCYSLTGDR